MSRVGIKKFYVLINDIVFVFYVLINDIVLVLLFLVS